MQRANYIVCRSGYSTVMELLALNKPALYVPTPGQTEQEYLAGYYKDEGLYDFCRQEDLDLKHLKFESRQVPIKRQIPINDLDHINSLLEKLCP